MRTERTETTPAGGSCRTEEPGHVEERRVVPGTARGRLHVGINWGAAFFGWVAAMGLAVILTAFVAAVGAAVGVTQGTTTPEQAATQIRTRTRGPSASSASSCWPSSPSCPTTAAATSRREMSGFDGPRQGFAVWLWAVLVAVVVAVVAAVAGARFDVLSTLNTFPGGRSTKGTVTGPGIIALLLLLAVTLVGAVLGGAAGMRYHRKLETAEAEYLD